MYKTSEILHVADTAYGPILSGIIENWFSLAMSLLKELHTEYLFSLVPNNMEHHKLTFQQMIKPTISKTCSGRQASGRFLSGLSWPSDYAVVSWKNKSCQKKALIKKHCDWNTAEQPWANPLILCESEFLMYVMGMVILLWKSTFTGITCSNVCLCLI